MDLNTLIATIVTATAALIAIIGGFLISRVITLSSEQSGIRRKLKEIRLSYHTHKRMLSEVEESILVEDQEDFITTYYVDLIFNKTSPEELLKQSENLSKERSLEDFEEVINELKQVNRDLTETFEQNGVSYSKDLPSKFNEFIDTSKLNVRGRQYWYKLLYEEHRSRLPSRPKTGFAVIDHEGSTFKGISSNTVTANIQSHAKIQAYEQKIRDRNRYKNEIHHLKNQENEQIKILKDYGKPKGMWGGLGVLIYASIVGIGYPIVLLPYPESTYNDGATKLFLLILFYSQLAVLFIYLWYNMLRLTKEVNTQQEISHEQES